MPLYGEPECGGVAVSQGRCIFRNSRLQNSTNLRKVLFSFAKVDSLALRSSRRTVHSDDVIPLFHLVPLEFQFTCAIPFVFESE